jgi:hypothetical protein
MRRDAGHACRGSRRQVWLMRQVDLYRRNISGWLGVTHLAPRAWHARTGLHPNHIKRCAIELSIRSRILGMLAEIL